MFTIWPRIVVAIFEIIKSYHHSGKNRFILYFDDGFACYRDNFYGFNWNAPTEGIQRENGATDYTASYFGLLHPIAPRGNSILATL